MASLRIGLTSFYVGSDIDAQDSFNKWNLASIVALTQTHVTVHFKGTNTT